MKFLLISLIILTSINLYATDLKKNLATLEVNTPLLNEVVKLSPVEKHHFNLEAPQNCSETKDSSSIDPSASTITCQFHKAGKHTITVSVCDDEKKYCKQEYFDVNVSSKNSGAKKIANSPISVTQESQTKLKKIILPGFHIANPSEAKKLLKPKHKGVIVLASAEWCPPCNKNKEFLFPQSEFQESSKSFLKIYVDGDSADMTQWKSLIDFKYYPSFIFLNRDFKQVDIRISDTDTYNFNQWTKAFDKISETPIKDVIKRFEARQNGSLWQKLKDFIKKTNHNQDQDRLVSWYENNYDFLSMYKVIENNQNKFPKLFQMAEIEHLTDLIDKSADGKQKEILQEKLDFKILKIFHSNPAEYITYTDLLQAKCSTPGKSPFNQSMCGKHINNYLLALKDIRDKNKDQLTDTDIAARAATYHSNKLKFTKLKNSNEEKLTSLRKNCFDSFELLKNFTPLKYKSRYTKTRQVNCLSEKSLESSGLAILNDLIQDYPHEEIYYRKKSKVLTSKKDYKGALKSIDQALKYSYGNLVYYNSISKAKILKKLGDVKSGKSLLTDLISSISLKKDSEREQRMLTMLRKTIKNISKEGT